MSKSQLRGHGAPVVAAAAGALLLLGGLATPAEAADSNGTCDSGEFCLYYNSRAYGYGSMFDSYMNRQYLDGVRFISAGAGQGRIVSNDSAAFVNRSNLCVMVYTGRRYSGTPGTVAGNSSGDFNATFKNNVESWRFYECS